MQYQQYAQARLSQPAYFILGCLSHGLRDAVALCEAIEQAEGLYIEPGSLYRVLAQLEQRGWITGDDGGERLRRYHITAQGMLALQQADRATEPPRNGVSPRVWIIIAPVLFLVFCMEFGLIGIPDYPNFREVFIFWLLTGLAGLIILLALKLGSGERTDLTAQEVLQQVQVQG